MTNITTTTDIPITPWQVTPAKVEVAIARIVEASEPQQVIVFGSYARGEAGPDSDLDLLVVVDDDVANSNHEAAKLYKTMLGVDMAVDIVVVRRKHLEQYKNVPGYVYYHALQEGQTVYERQHAA